MSRPLLILDANHLCHRSFHIHKKLFDGDRPTGTIFGFLQSVAAMIEEHQTDRVAFCFDHKESLRKKLFPGYKSARTNKVRTDEEQQEYRDFVAQVDALRDRYLKRIGFRNVFCFQGYESDDIMARLAASVDDQDEAIIFTSDHDLYQCLRPNISICNGSPVFMTWASFCKEYGFFPSSWSLYKAITGCKSDSVPGIPGVGKKTALAFIRGGIGQDNPRYQKIVSGRKTILFNKKLVHLPLDGCPKPKLVADAFSESGWLSVCKELGFTKLSGRCPGASRRTRKTQMDLYR